MGTGRTGTVTTGIGTAEDRVGVATGERVVGGRGVVDGKGVMIRGDITVPRGSVTGRGVVVGIFIMVVDARPLFGVPADRSSNACATKQHKGQLILCCRQVVNIPSISTLLYPA